ncbi:hypothetical protein I2486_18500 [Cellulophaga sp. E16_2]|uniref:hypothetical protein n=1 Tax=Cellulophaga sp. E16_2 TaxID=2789297 RepID=UPI001A9326A9|nr:hypothetical protein [Cellulophaga sp. E16_2]MBO0593392.1 hypothetical protein [Cellulophaga sp. E16_2]
MFLILMASCNLSAGSYPYAEIYLIKLPEEQLVTKINNFKDNNIEYKVPSSLGLVDGKSSPNDHWHNFYFKNPKNNQIIKTWVRKNTNNNTKFAFISIKDDTSLGHWKNINKDFDTKRNKETIQEFESIILKKIGLFESQD